ncbi:hypothetical protein ACFWJU_37805 [Streptomyces mutabilis]|uniref:hypothetical protein n=1 Tax=Streptomyces mutabilis TaxID=67332 RepID=UPI00365983C5
MCSGQPLVASASRRPETSSACYTGSSFSLPLRGHSRSPSLPGDNTISATAEVADAVVERAQRIASYGLDFELPHLLVRRRVKSAVDR